MRSSFIRPSPQTRGLRQRHGGTGRRGDILIKIQVITPHDAADEPSSLPVPDDPTPYAKCLMPYALPHSPGLQKVACVLVDLTPPRPRKFQLLSPEDGTPTREERPRPP